MNSPLFSLVKRNRSISRSQAFTEFAMVLPIFLTLMCGVIDYGFMIGNSLMLAVSAREGANTGSRQPVNALSNGLAAAVLVSAKRLDLTGSNGGAIITKIYYDPNVSTVYVCLNDTNNFTNSCMSTGSIYGGTNYLMNQSRILVGTNQWQSMTRILPFIPANILAANTQTMVVMEVFYTNSFVTPIGTLIGLVTPPVLYDSAFF